ncbi:SHOCT domain-containing protein [Actinocorallia sp. B10E7]|uniref:SHOCT domain-containing protein n=1 Tax=Actinocorallia sp. B10E7 TaxID=3153558 RepID=UPI00325C84B2
MDDYPLLEFFWTMLVFFTWILWLVLLFKIINDIFRSHDLSGWGKTGWLILILVLPFLGVFIYLIARGTDMSRREMERLQQQEQEFRAYVRETAGPGGGTSHADELSKLVDLKNRGAITEEEYQRAKEKVLG